MVDDLIKKKFGIKLSLSSGSRLLQQLRFSPQKPLHRAYQQNPETVAEWKSKVFSEIKKRAKKLGAKIYFVDESAVRSDYPSSRTWVPKGEAPVVESTGARFSVNMIAAIDYLRRMRFMATKGKVVSGKVCAFLEKRIHDN